MNDRANSNEQYNIETKMAINFRKRKKILPGVYLNFSKRESAQRLDREVQISTSERKVHILTQEYLELDFIPDKKLVAEAEVAQVLHLPTILHQMPML